MYEGSITAVVTAVGNTDEFILLCCAAKAKKQYRLDWKKLNVVTCFGKKRNKSQ